MSDDESAVDAAAYVLVRSETIFEVTDRERLFAATRAAVDARHYADTVSGLAERDGDRVAAAADVAEALGTAPGSVDSLPVRVAPRWKDVRHAEGVPAGVSS